MTNRPVFGCFSSIPMTLTATTMENQGASTFSTIFGSNGSSDRFATKTSTVTNQPISSYEIVTASIMASQSSSTLPTIFGSTGTSNKWMPNTFNTNLFFKKTLGYADDDMVKDTVISASSNIFSRNSNSSSNINNMNDNNVNNKNSNISNSDNQVANIFQSRRIKLNQDPTNENDDGNIFGEKKENASSGRTPIRKRFSRKQSISIEDSVTLAVREIPKRYNNVAFLSKHFSSFGKVEKIYTNIKSNSAIVHFDTHDSAVKAKERGQYFSTNCSKPFKLFWKVYNNNYNCNNSSNNNNNNGDGNNDDANDGIAVQKQGDLRTLLRNKVGITTTTTTAQHNVNNNDNIGGDGDGVNIEYNNNNNNNSNNNNNDEADDDDVDNDDRTDDRYHDDGNVGDADDNLKKHQQQQQQYATTTAAATSTFTATNATSLMTSLRSLTTVKTLTSSDRINVLDQRDKLLKIIHSSLKQHQQQQQIANINIAPATSTSVANIVVVGICPDMCPEKERYMREVQRRLSMYEIIQGSEKNPMVDHNRAVKEYIRSSADQDMPLPDELRPPAILDMTMDYLLSDVMDRGGPGMWGEWYNFLWNRMRAIRKDITQQHLCDSTSVRLTEKSTRFHILCSAILCEEDASVFDQKINSENLTKCLQSLKELYHDLGEEGCRDDGGEVGSGVGGGGGDGDGGSEKGVQCCPNESEFRSYMILMNLNNGDILREAHHWSDHIRQSDAVRQSIDIHTAVTSNNYVKFFRIVRRSSFLTSCILHRYFNQMRMVAIKRIVKAFHSPANPGVVVYSSKDLLDQLGYDNVNDLHELLTHFNLAPNFNNNDNNTTFDYISLGNRSNRVIESDQTLQLKRSFALVESKMDASLGEIVNGGPLKVGMCHGPHFSFDNDGFYKVDDATMALLQQHQQLQQNQQQLQQHQQQLQQHQQQQQQQLMLQQQLKQQQLQQFQQQQLILQQKQQQLQQFQQQQQRIYLEAAREVTKAILLETINEMIEDLCGDVHHEMFRKEVYMGEFVRELVKEVVRETVYEAYRDLTTANHQMLQKREMMTTVMYDSLMDDVINDGVFDIAAEVYCNLENSKRRAMNELANELLENTVNEMVKNKCWDFHKFHVSNKLKNLKRFMERRDAMMKMKYFNLWIRILKVKKSNEAFPSLPNISQHWQRTFNKMFPNISVDPATFIDNNKDPTIHHQRLPQIFVDFNSQQLQQMLLNDIINSNTLKVDENVAVSLLTVEEIELQQKLLKNKLQKERNALDVDQHFSEAPIDMKKMMKRVVKMNCCHSDDDHITQYHKLVLSLPSKNSKDLNAFNTDLETTLKWIRGKFKSESVLNNDGDADNDDEYNSNSDVGSFTTLYSETFYGDEDDNDDNNNNNNNNNNNSNNNNNNNNNANNNNNIYNNADNNNIDDHSRNKFNNNNNVNYYSNQITHTKDINNDVRNGTNDINIFINNNMNNNNNNNITTTMKTTIKKTINVCIKTMYYDDDDDYHHHHHHHCRHHHHQLLGTTGILFTLSHYGDDDDDNEEAIQSDAVRLKNLFLTIPSHPAIPILLICRDHRNMSKALLSRKLGVRELLRKGVISNHGYQIVGMGVDVRCVEASNVLANSIDWLLREFPEKLKIITSPFIEYFEGGVYKYFVSNVMRYMKGGPLDDDDLNESDGDNHHNHYTVINYKELINMYNDIILWMTTRITDQHLTNFNYPVVEFCSMYKGELPALNWNTREKLSELNELSSHLLLPEFTHDDDDESDDDGVGGCDNDCSFYNDDKGDGGCDDGGWSKGCKRLWKYLQSLVEDTHYSSNLITKVQLILEKSRKELDRCDRNMDLYASLRNKFRQDRIGIMNRMKLQVILGCVEFQMYHASCSNEELDQDEPLLVSYCSSQHDTPIQSELFEKLKGLKRPTRLNNIKSGHNMSHSSSSSNNNIKYNTKKNNYSNSNDTSNKYNFSSKNNRTGISFSSSDNETFYSAHDTTTSTTNFINTTNNNNRSCDNNNKINCINNSINNNSSVKSNNNNNNSVLSDENESLIRTMQNLITGEKENSLSYEKYLIDVITNKNDEFNDKSADSQRIKDRTNLKRIRVNSNEQASMRWNSPLSLISKRVCSRRSLDDECLHLNGGGRIGVDDGGDHYLADLRFNVDQEKRANDLYELKLKLLI